MLLYKKPFLIILFLISTNLFAEYEIEINFESGIEFKSQQLLIETLSKTNSKRKIEKVLISEDWIENYSIMQNLSRKKFLLELKIENQY